MNTAEVMRGHNLTMRGDVVKGHLFAIRGHREVKRVGNPVQYLRLRLCFRGRGSGGTAGSINGRRD